MESLNLKEEGGVQSDFNQKGSDRLAQDPKVQAYTKWALENGCKMEKVLFPACFGPDDNLLEGAAAREEIAPNEAVIMVPMKMLLTPERARSSEIGHIFENHDTIFKASVDRDYFALLVFMIYERQKKEKSFWWPYFQAVDPIDLCVYWDKKYLDVIQDY